MINSGEPSRLPVLAPHLHIPPSRSLAFLELILQILRLLVVTLLQSPLVWPQPAISRWQFAFFDASDFVQCSCKSSHTIMLWRLIDKWSSRPNGSFGD